MLFLFTSLFTLTADSSTAKAGQVEVNKESDYRLNVKSITLVKGKAYTIKVYNLGENAKVSYKSDDVEVASVSDSGEIAANKVGTTIVTALVKDGSNTTPLTCEVTVGLPAFSVKLTKSRLIMGLDKTDFLNVILKPINTVESARFSSYDSQIASVSTAGRVTAKKTGLTYVFAEIEATNADGTRKYSKCTVIVISQEDVSLLETYFSDHPELDYAAEDDVTKALYEYFNTKYSESSSSFISSLNQFLDEKLNLGNLKALRDADLAKSQTNN